MSVLNTRLFNNIENTLHTKNNSRIVEQSVPGKKQHFNNFSRKFQLKIYIVFCKK